MHTDSNRNQVIAHEIGHALRMRHLQDNDRTSTDHWNDDGLMHDRALPDRLRIDMPNWVRLNENIEYVE